MVPNSSNHQEIVRQQESLRSVIESISSELELRPLLTRIVFHACELLGADNGTIGLVDEVRNVVRTEAAWRMPPDELGREMPPGIGLAGEVLLTGRPVVMQRYGDVPHPIQHELKANAVIGVPIVWRERMIGFFGLGSSPPRTFDDHDVEVLSLFAKHAAIAIENARLFTGMQNALREAQLLYETSRRIGTALDIQEVVAAYLEQVAARGRFACSVALYQKQEDGATEAIVVKGRWAPGEGHSQEEWRFQRTQDALDPPLDAGQTITIYDVDTDPRVTEELRAIQRASQRPALAMIPLMVRDERIGLVILSNLEPRMWSEEELRPYQSTAAQLATAIDSRLQLLALQERDRQMAVLEERQRLARDLHDSVTQLLFSITLIAQTIQAAWQRSPEEGEKRIARLLELSQAAHTELRALLAELRPPQGETGLLPTADHAAIGGAGAADPSRHRGGGLDEAVRQHMDRHRRDGLYVSLDMARYQPQAAEIEEVVLRIVQEALNNVVKHAQARRADVSIATEGGNLTAIIQDDGVGFVATEQRRSDESAGGMGLENMCDRAAELGGRCEIRSAPGQGTIVTFTLPIQERQA